MNYRNLVEMFRLQAERYGPRPILRYKRYGLYHDLSWESYRDQALACAAGLVAQGINAGDRVGLLSENRLEWLIADMGILAAGAVNVPLHAPLSGSQIHFQLADAGARWLFVSTPGQLDKVRPFLNRLPDLQGIVTFEKAGEPAYPWSSFLSGGRRQPAEIWSELKRRESRLGPDDLATLMYTSGTTGNPKGVMLTHGNLLSNALATNEASPRGPEAVMLSWLPFSHIYSRTVDYYLSLVTGITLALAESADTVVENLEEVRPTHMSSVPRFYEKVLAAVKSGAADDIGKKLRDIFGPRLDWLGSGGAPLPPAVAREYRETGLLILQGYGLTESSPVITFNRKDRFKLETVGLAIPGIDLAIAPDGEILTRGPHVMKGYWNNPQASAEALRDGWLHTGDVGRLDEEGFLTITGRKKDILVLSNGKKVAPAYLEGLLIGDPSIDQAVIYGEGRSFLSALIVPNWDYVRKEMGDQDTRRETLARCPALQELLRRRIEAALAGVSTWEQVRQFIVLPDPFSVEAGELTVSLKMRRNVVFAKYRQDLEKLYETATGTDF